MKVPGILPNTFKPSRNTVMSTAIDMATIFKTIISAHDQLNETLLRLRLETPIGYQYHAGQQVTLYGQEGIKGNFCLSSVAEIDDFLEIYLESAPEFSHPTNPCHEFKAGAEVSISETSDCFFYPINQPPQPVLLIGNGIGLAPLFGIAREALIKYKLKQQVRLFHLTQNKDEYSLIQEMISLLCHYRNFGYRHYISGERKGLTKADLAEVIPMAFCDINDLSNWRLFICGDADFVNDIVSYAMTRKAKADNILQKIYVKN